MSCTYLQKQSIFNSAPLEGNKIKGCMFNQANQSLQLSLSKSIIGFQGSYKKIGSYSYDLNCQIGSGFSSKVYKGHCLKDNSQCAVKVIELKKLNASGLQMLDNQIKILKDLHHPNIIKCYSVYKTVKNCYIITQYCLGGDLLTYLRKHRQLSEIKAVDIIGQIIEGEKYMLGKGILHRDLKPANILHDGKRWKIADFGFAIHTYREIKIKNNVGTPLYMPLQSLSSNIYSPLTDIFSIGVVFYQMLAGVTPWQSQNETDLIKRMKNLPYRLSQNFKVSLQTRQILRKLCASDPQKRMTKKEFMELNLTKQKDNQKEKKSLSKVHFKRSLSKMNYLESAKSLTLLIQKPDHQNPQIDERTQIKNKHIQTAQIQYCRFLYYLIKNAHHLMINEINKNKVIFICHQHLHNLINHLADEQHNWFGLSNWNTYKHSQKYKQIQIDIKRYYERYQQSYQKYRNQNIFENISKMKDISKLLYAESFSEQIYKIMIKVVASIIREANHNVSVVFVNPSISFSSELKANIEGLKSLHEYYKLIEVSLNYYEDYAYFERLSNIKVQIDYQTAPKITLTEYTQLRQKLKTV